MGAPINIAEFKSRLSPLPEEAAAFDKLFRFFPKPSPYLQIEFVCFTECQILDDILNAGTDVERTAIEEGFIPFGDSNGNAYAIWLKAPNGARPVVILGSGYDCVMAPSVEAFLELLAIGYPEPYSRRDLLKAPTREWNLTDKAAFQRHFMKSFNRKSLPKTGEAAVASTEKLEAAFQTWLDSTFKDR